MKKAIGILTAVIIAVSSVTSMAKAEDILAKRMAANVIVGQQACVEKLKTECEIFYIADPPKYLTSGESTGYKGVFNSDMLYIFFAVGEYDNMDPDIYLFDSKENILNKGIETGPVEVVLYIPKYRQKIFAGIKLQQGRGRVGFGVLKPVGE